jgi:5'-3' exonuclease
MILLVDGNNLVNAAYSVAKNNNNEGYIEIASNIFKSMIYKLRRDFLAKEIYIAWDGSGGSEWRKKVLPEYKSGRSKEGKEDIFECLNLCREIKEHNNFHFNGYEADDVIYALCRAIKDEKIIVSADKDFIQIIQEGLANKLYNPIQKKFREIPQECAISRSAICGADDSLKGVPGKGPAFFKKFIEGKVCLNKEENEIYEKHRLVVGLKYNPYKDQLLELVNKKMYQI